MIWMMVLAHLTLRPAYLGDPREVAEKGTPVRLVQVFPTRDSFPEDSTVVRVGYTASELVIFARCFQKEPIHAPSRRRDATGLRYGKEDAFIVALAPSGRGGDVYFITVNPRGAYADFSSGGEWDTEVHVETRTHPWGWEVLLQIPFRNLAYARTAWGVDFARLVYASSSVQLLTPRENFDDFTQVAEMVLDFDRIQRPWTLHLIAIPTLRLEADTTDLRKSRVRAGLTLRARRLQESLFEGTLYPDFSEVDVDIQQFDLSLLPVNYPEKRPFFVEGRAFLDQPRDLVRTRNFYLPEWGAKFYATTSRSSFIALALKTNFITDTAAYHHADLFRYTYRPSPALTLGTFGAVRDNGETYGAADVSWTLSRWGLSGNAQVSRQFLTQSNHVKVGLWRSAFVGFQGGGYVEMVDPGFLGELNRIQFYFDDMVRGEVWFNQTWTVKERPLWLASLNGSLRGRWVKSTGQALSRQAWIGGFAGPYPWVVGGGVSLEDLAYLREGYGLSNTHLILFSVYLNREGGTWDRVQVQYDFGRYGGQAAYNATLALGRSFPWGINLGLQAFRVWLPAVGQNPLVVQLYGEWALSPRLFVKPYLAWQRTCRGGHLLCEGAGADGWNLNLVVAWEPAYLSGVYLAVNRMMQRRTHTERGVFKVQWGIQTGW